MDEDWAEVRREWEHALHVMAWAGLEEVLTPRWRWWRRRYLRATWRYYTAEFEFLRAKLQQAEARGVRT